MANIKGVRLTDPLDGKVACPVKAKPIRSTDPRKSKVVGALCRVSGALRVTSVGVVGEGSRFEKFVGHCLILGSVPGLPVVRNWTSLGWWSVAL
jgi:hypothetical protein